jgi:tetratricopeptide (TPR) repeat protein
MPAGVSAAELETCWALNRQGITLAQQGRLEEAADALREALRRHPDFMEAHCNLGLVFTFQGRFAEAVACLEKALVLRPGDPILLNNISNALRELGELDRAVAAARQALALLPDYADAHNNLGAALLQQRRHDEAYASFQSAVRLNPASPEVHSNLGEVCHRLQLFSDAIRHGREAVRLRPDFAEGYCKLGAALTSDHAYDEAEACLQQSLRLKPDLPDTSLNLGQLFLRQGRLAEAEVVCRQLLARLPEQAEAHNGLGVILKKQGRHDEARACLEQAIQLKPSFAAAHFHLGMLLLLQGDFERGLSEYEWRWQFICLRPLSGPVWDGSSLDGRTLVLHAEQGTGDTLQFIRYAPLLRRRGATVLFAGAPELVPLLSGAGVVDGFVRAGEPPPQQAVHAFLMSLPLLMETTAATIPAEVPYLTADPVLVEQWRAELARLPGRKIGVCWQGNRHHPEDRQRSFPLTQLAPLARLPDVHLVSLQVGHGSEQVAALAGQFEIFDPGARIHRADAAFVDTAALMRSLDLVVTCDTAVAHLAGALGVPTWVALPFAPDWRWQLGRADSPWYPSLRLFRQSRAADWDGVFEPMARELADRR